MSGSQHIALYTHLLDCQVCLISNQWFCTDAKAMGQGYTEHVNSFTKNKREAMHDDFVSAVVKGRIKREYNKKHDLARAA